MRRVQEVALQHILFVDLIVSSAAWNAKLYGLDFWLNEPAVVPALTVGRA